VRDLQRRLGRDDAVAQGRGVGHQGVGHLDADRRLLAGVGHVGGGIGDEAYLERLKQLRAAVAATEGDAQDGVSADRAVEWLRALAETWTAADVREAKADLLHAIYERIVVAGRSFVGARLTPAAYAHGLALALPEEVVLARPTGVGRALATYRVPIEGRDEWIAAAARHLA
jgi:hypothetical protein